MSTSRVVTAPPTGRTLRSPGRPELVTDLELTLACGNYDRTRGLADGSVAVEGATVRYITLDPEEIFFRMLRHREFDVSELSMSSYVLALSRGACDFVAIPVFPSRMFRH